MLCLLDPGDLTARQSTFGCGEFGNVVEEEQKSQVDLGYSETVTFTVRVGHNGRQGASGDKVVEGHNGQQGAGGDNWLWKGTTARKVLGETIGCGRAQRSARVRRKKSYTAAVGKGPAEEVL